MPGWLAVHLTADAEDLADDVRRIFEDFESQGRRHATAAAGQCTPTLDVVETDEFVEIVVDLPGVSAAGVRVVLKGTVVLVVGEKLPAAAPAADRGDYHLVERAFGRFARAVRIASAFDGSAARASLVSGELRIVLPKIHDRRGQPRTVPIGHEQIGDQR
jgi:HSP20 family protein